MTQIRKAIIVVLTAAAFLTGLALTTDSPAAPAEVQVQEQMRAIDLPSERFLALVFGPEADYTAYEADRLGGIADNVCEQLDRGFTWMSIRAGLVENYGFRVSEAGMLISAAQVAEC